MKFSRRPRSSEEEEESVFITMTDMTVSFLFIFMILLAFFAAQVNDEENVPRSLHNETQRERDAARDMVSSLQEKMKLTNPLEEYLTDAAEQRVKILNELKNRLLIDFPDIQIAISDEQDALRFQGEGLFKSGSSNLETRQKKIIETIGSLLNDILSCYTLGAPLESHSKCSDKNALIEAVQIEGHTDTDGNDASNLRLSTDRANSTFLAIVESSPSILSHKNFRGQPVLSVSGYGEMRPVATNETIVGKSINRRIDLRMIMHAPSSISEIEEIRQRFKEMYSTERK